MTVVTVQTWSIYACPEHGPEHISELYGWCDALVGSGNKRCRRDAEWITVQVVGERD